MKHRKHKITLILLLLVILLCAAALFLCSRLVLIDGKVCAVNAETLDLSGRPLTQPEKLSRLQQLQQLDLRGTGISAQTCRKIRQMLPHCDVLWEVPFREQYLPEDTGYIALADPTSADVEQLALFPALETIDVTACTDYQEILQLRERFPQCRILYRLTLEDTQLTQDTTELTLRDSASIAAALACAPQLTRIDAAQCPDTAALQALQQQYPGCRLIYSLPIENASVLTDAQTLVLSSVSSEALTQALPYLTDLQSVEIQSPVADPAQLLALEQSYPEIAFTYSFDLLGVTVSNRDTAIDLSNISMKNTDALEAALPCFRNLEKVDMCGCGISNEDMAALNQRHPETLFVWMVDIGRIRTRTDVTYFMPYQYGINLQDSETANLKYLTELICLDLGHQNIVSTDFLAYMTKMQYLIVVDNGVTDISGCANMPDLKFVELYLTGITDFSPLLACTKLEDLNVGYCHPKDWTVFCQMKQLQRFYWCGMHSAERQQALREALPDTFLMFEGVSSTGNGWRESPNYYAMRDMLGMDYMTY